MEAKSPMTALQRLLEEPKGKVTYAPDEAFMLCVFWEAPSLSAAHELLAALKLCATATQRDTPCVPTYCFRISNNNIDLFGSGPKTVADHPQLRDAKKKLDVGIPRAAVTADMVRRSLDPKLIDLNLSDALPIGLQERPVIVECFELYLDERAFNEHAGSKDYLAAYGAVMKPGLQNRQCTVRLGTPTSNLVEKILEPMLKEVVAPVPSACTIWRRPVASDHTAAILSLDVAVDLAAQDAVEAVAAKIPAGLRDRCTTCVAFLHPLRLKTVRILCILSSLPEQSVFRDFAALRPLRGEVYCEEAVREAVRVTLEEAGLGLVSSLNAADFVGYLIHERAPDLVESRT